MHHFFKPVLSTLFSDMASLKNFNSCVVPIICILVCIVQLSYGQPCYTGETFHTLPCGGEFHGEISILSGLASVSSSHTLVSVGNSFSYSPCDWELGTCSTSTLALESGLACSSEDCTIILEFTHSMESVAVGKMFQNVFSESAIEVTAYSGSEIAFVEQIERFDQECSSPSSFAFTHAAGFDRVVIRGNKLVISEVSACVVQAPEVIKYNGGDTCSSVMIGECTYCTDIFGAEHWSKVSCNASGDCTSIRYSSENCTGLGIRTPLPKLSCDEISTTFQVAAGAMCFTAQLPRASF
jgi:hypothetical protein